MQTTTAEYKIDVTTNEGSLSFRGQNPPNQASKGETHIAKLGNYAKAVSNWTNIKVTTELIKSAKSNSMLLVRSLLRPFILRLC